MGKLTNKYGTKPPCGCEETGNVKPLGHKECCKEYPQATPQPSCGCEEHDCPKQPEGFNDCLFVCNPTVSSTTPFFLTFKNLDDPNQLTINTSEIFFHHHSIGLIEILGKTETSFQVNLKNPARAGIEIKPEDCIRVVVRVAEESGGTTRCLCGKFTSPEVDGTPETIYIYNGSGIKVGANIMFTGEGGTWTYTVTEFVSASNNVYAYKVSNTGEGAPAGTQFDGGVAGSCSIPIVVEDTVDICNLSETSLLDEVSGCLNGVPRGLVPEKEGDVIAANADKRWEPRSVTNLDCCIFTEGCVKLSDAAGPLATDTVLIKDVGLECFNEAYDNAVSTSSTLNVTADTGELFAVLGWDAGNRLLTLGYATKDFQDDGEPFIELPEGTRLCLGECCNRCNNENQQTDHKNQGMPGPENSATISVNVADVPYRDGEIVRYLVGEDQAGTPMFVELTDGWESDPNLAGTEGFPSHKAPLLVRSKTCNSSPRACNQKYTSEYQALNLNALNVPEGVSVFVEFGSAIRTSRTLCDGVTLSPNDTIAGGNRATGLIVGPTVSSTILENTRLVSQSLNITTKHTPKISIPTMRQFANLFRFNCANEILWAYVEIKADAGVPDGTLNLQFGGNRYYELQNFNQFETPANDPDLEPWFGESL